MLSPFTKGSLKIAPLNNAAYFNQYFAALEVDRGCVLVGEADIFLT
jgi:hypothetical protein